MKYLFIDGEYFSRRLTECEKDLGFPLLDEINFERIAWKYERVFYYDALPVQKKNESSSDFESRLQKKMHFLDKIRSSSKCHVRDGLARAGSTGEISLQQKGVDVKLAVDVMVHALSGNLEVASILTGDLDFFPIFQALQNTRARGEVIFFQKSISSVLVSMADFSRGISVVDAIEWTGLEQYRNLLPNQNSNGNYHLENPSSIIISKPSVWGEANFYFDDHANIVYVAFEKVGNVLSGTHPFLFFLKLTELQVSLSLAEILVLFPSLKAYLQ